MSICDDRQMAKPATGKTPIRNARIPDHVWLPALAKAEALGLTASDAMTGALQTWTAEPLPSAYEFTFSNWPEAREWTAAHSAFEALGKEISDATEAITPEYLAVATWLAATHHRTDPAQQKRVITGHVVRRAQQVTEGGWRDRYRDTRHLSDTVQAILDKYLPLGG
jgi:hypothetical protein